MRTSIIKYLTLAIALGCGALNPRPAAAQLGMPCSTNNLLINPSFEDGTFLDNGDGCQTLLLNATTMTGWTVISDQIARCQTPNIVNIPASHGSMFLDLSGYDNNLPHGGVQQTVTTVPGQIYTLAFDLGVVQGVPDLAGPITVQATVTGWPAQQFTHNPPGTGVQWAKYGFTFTASSASTTVTLEGISTTAYYIGLDNVSLCAEGGVSPVITMQPQSLTVTQNQSAGFSVATTGTAPFSYQWRRGGAAVAGATNDYLILSDVPLAEDGKLFRVVVSNAAGSVTSDPATLHVVPDVIPPTVDSVVASCESNKVTVMFSERVTGAEDASIYQISGGVTVASVALGAGGHTVCLFTSPLAPGVTYTLTVCCLQDVAANPIAPGTSILFACAPPCANSQTFLSLHSGRASSGLLAAGAADLQFTLGGSGNPPTHPVVVAPAPPEWVPSGPLSQWIGPSASLGLGSGGTFYYTNRFFLPCLDRARITGRWMGDDAGAILLNGNPTGNNLPNGWAFTNWHPVSISTGFVPGWNELVFGLINGGDASTGMRVELTGAYCADGCPPCLEIVCPPDLVVADCAPGSAVVYVPPAVALGCGSLVSLDCTPPRGSYFPPGTNVVHCEAIDSLGNSASCEFTIIVLPGVGPQCPPALTLAAQGTNLVVGWPESFGVIELQATDSLTPPIVWTPVTVPAVLADGRYQVTLPASGPQQFFKGPGGPGPTPVLTCQRTWGPSPDLVCLLDAEMAKEGLAHDNAARSYSVGYDNMNVGLRALLLIRDAAGNLLSRNHWFINPNRHLYAGVWAEPSGAAVYTVGTHDTTSLIPNLILNQWMPGPGTPWTAPVTAVSQIFTPAALGLLGQETWGCRVVEASATDLFISGCTDRAIFVARVDKATLNLVTSWGVNGVQSIASFAPNGCPKHAMPGAFLLFNFYPQAFIEIAGGRLYLGGTLLNDLRGTIQDFDFVAACYSAAAGAPLWATGPQYSFAPGDDYMKAMAATTAGLNTVGTLDPSGAPQMQLLSWLPSGAVRLPGVIQQPTPSRGNDVEAVATSCGADVYVGGYGLAGGNLTGATWHYRHGCKTFLPTGQPLSLLPQWAGATGGFNPKPYGALADPLDEVFDLGLSSGPLAGYCFATGGAHFGGQFAQPLQCIAPGGGVMFSSPPPLHNGDDRGIAVNYHPGTGAVFTHGTVHDPTGVLNCFGHWLARNSRFQP